MFAEGFSIFLFHLCFYFCSVHFIFPFSLFPRRNLPFCPINRRDPFFPLQQGEIPATELATIPGRSHRIPGLVFKVLVSCSGFFPRLIFLLNVAYIFVYLHFQLFFSLLKSNPTPFGHSTSYCWPFYDLQITQLCLNG